MSAIYHFIHSHGAVADLAYKTWHRIYDAKETLRPPSRNQKPTCGGLYPVVSLNIATTEICNSKCIFCPHRHAEDPTAIMPMDLFRDIIDGWREFGGNPKKSISLTPGTPPGEALCDAKFPDKLDYVRASGYKAFLVTNGIRLHAFADVLTDGGMEQIGISIGSLDPRIYRETYGVDRCEQVKANILDFLELNKSKGHPVDVTIVFRNCEAPSEIIGHPDFAKFKRYFNGKVRCMFTTWWDDWNGAVSHEEMERGWIKVRKPLNLNRVCQGALSMAMRPTDRLIRLCGCRYVPGQDDLIVGDIDKGFADAQRNAFKIQEGFHVGVRPATCTNCGAYKQA